MNEATAKRIVELMNDEAFDEKMSNATSLEEAVAILTENGVAISAAELQALALNVPHGELTAEDLDEVAGGAWYNDAWNAVKSGAKAIWSHGKRMLDGLVDGFNGSYTN